MAVPYERTITETLGIYSPAMGPPSWRADGTGSARTQEEFEVQARVYREWLVSSGLGQMAAPGVITNAVAYSPSLPTVEQRTAAAAAATPPPLVVAGVVQPAKAAEAPKPDAPKPGATVVRSIIDAVKKPPPPPPPSCPAGMEAVLQGSGSWTCIGGLQTPNLSDPRNNTMAGILTQQFLSGTGIGTSSPFQQQSALDWGGVISSVGNVGCNLITNAAARTACLALAQGVGGALGTSDTRGVGLNPVQTQQSLTPSCPQGMVWNGQACVNPGVGGVLERALPGDIGRPDMVFQGAAGTMGGVAPINYSTIRRVCPKRYALGLDNICYPKPMLPRAFRKWVPPRKPLLTGGEVRVLQRAKSLQKRVRKLAGKVAPKAKSCASCSSSRAKKK